MHFHIFLNPFFTIKEIFFLFPFTEYFCRTVNKRFGAGMNTLMSIYDGFGPSIFCRKVEKARPMREGMDGRVVYFPPESALPPMMLCFSTVLFPISTLTWRSNNYVSARKKYKYEKRKYNVRTLENLTELFESHSRQHFIIFQELFRTFAKTLWNCIEPSSERVYNYF